MIRKGSLTTDIITPLLIDDNPKLWKVVPNEEYWYVYALKVVHAENGPKWSHMSSWLQVKNELALRAVQRDPSAYAHFLGSVRFDREIALHAVRDNWSQMRNVPKELTSDISFLVEAAGVLPENIRWSKRMWKKIPKESRANKEEVKRQFMNMMYVKG